jgi:hypothetical protein
LSAFSPKSFKQIEACIEWATQHGYEFADAATQELRRALAAYGKVTRTAHALQCSQVAVYDLLKKPNGREIVALRLKNAGRNDLAILFVTEKK